MAKLKDRGSNRLWGYDYSLPGAYFITICVEGRTHILGEIKDGRVQLSAQGILAEYCWIQTNNHFPNALLDTSVIMPNHIHAIIEILEPCRGGVTPPLQENATLGQIVGYYKYQSTKAINRLTGSPGERFWQRNYYDHIIRNDQDLNRLRQYILHNPLRWEYDRYYFIN